MFGEPWKLVTGGIAALLIGISKAGFGGGIGMLATPLCVLAFGPKDAIGVLLPMLIVGDFFSLLAYWRRWRGENLFYLLPGVLVGIVLGIGCIGRFSPRQLNFVIGFLAVGFVGFQIFRDWIVEKEKVFRPNYKVGFLFGLATGLTSTFAHGAGPVVTMFLLPQRLPKQLFVGTMVLIFTCVNWLKMPFYCLDQQAIPWSWLPSEAIINRHTLPWSFLFMPWIPVGVWLGVRLNRWFPEIWFQRVIYLLLFLTGLQLIFHFDLADWFQTLFGG